MVHVVLNLLASVKTSCIVIILPGKPGGVSNNYLVITEKTTNEEIEQRLSDFAMADTGLGEDDSNTNLEKKPQD